MIAPQNNAALRADRPDSSLRKERWFGMTNITELLPSCRRASIGLLPRVKMTILEENDDAPSP
jgi:hypothetical protein